MQKYLFILFLVILSLIVTVSFPIIALFCNPGEYKADGPGYRVMVNDYFSTELNVSNSTEVFCYDPINKDLQVVVHYKLSDEYAECIREQSNRWGGDTAQLTRHYIEPYLGIMEGLDVMISEAETGQIRMNVNIIDHDEVNGDVFEDFSVLMFNEETNMLYWFLKD